MPHVIADAAGKPVGPMRDGDSVVFFNFRADRMRQIIRAMSARRLRRLRSRRARRRSSSTTMTEYDPTFTFPIVFPPTSRRRATSPRCSPAHGLTNLRLAETEKYAHVTYFFNGGREEPFPGEDRVLVPSPKVPTYDLKPEMSARGRRRCARRQRLGAASTTSSSATSPTRTWWATPAVSRRRSRRSRPSTAVSARIIPAILAARRHRARHRRPRQRRADVGLRAERAAHRAHDQPGAAHPGGWSWDRRIRRALATGALCDIAPTMLALLGLEPSKEMTGKDLHRRIGARDVPKQPCRRRTAQIVQIRQIYVAQMLSAQSIWWLRFSSARYCPWLRICRLALHFGNFIRRNPE